MDVTDTVNVDCAIAPVRLIDEGLNEHVIPVTTPPQLKFTVPPAPLEELTSTVNFEVPPTAMEAVVLGITDPETEPTDKVTN
jgi:hypothetical protein